MHSSYIRTMFVSSQTGTDSKTTSILWNIWGGGGGGDGGMGDEQLQSRNFL